MYKIDAIQADFLVNAYTCSQKPSTYGIVTMPTEMYSHAKILSILFF